MCRHQGDDSGGRTMNFGNAADGRWTAIGIVSFGSSQQGCTNDYLDAFTRVIQFLPGLD